MSHTECCAAEANIVSRRMSPYSLSHLPHTQRLDPIAYDADPDPALQTAALGPAVESIGSMIELHSNHPPYSRPDSGVTSVNHPHIGQDLLCMIWGGSARNGKYVPTVKFFRETQAENASSRRTYLLVRRWACVAVYTADVQKQNQGNHPMRRGDRSTPPRKPPNFISAHGENDEAHELVNIA